MYDFLMKKAELVLGGDVAIPDGYDDPLFEHRDGRPVSAVLLFGGCNVRKRFSSKGEFFLRPAGGGYVLERGDETFLEGVTVKRMFCHSPDLAVISLAKDGSVLSTEEAMSLLDGYASQSELKGITLHGSSPCTREHYLEVVRAFHGKYPALHLGIGAPDLSMDDMRMFRDAGADNFKHTVQSPVRRVMEKLDPSCDIDENYRYLERAVEVFGKGSVVCTVYLGFGESDGEFLEGVERICAIGAMPDVKVKKFRGDARREAESKLGSIGTTTPERYASVLREVKAIMEKHGLEPSSFTTMCYGCRCCTIVPFLDF